MSAYMMNQNVRKQTKPKQLEHNSADNFWGLI